MEFKNMITEIKINQKGLVTDFSKQKNEPVNLKLKK